MRIAPLLLGISSWLVACGGPGNFDGTVGGVSLKTKETIFFQQPFQVVLPGQSVPANVGNAVSVVMSNQEGTCDRLKNGQAAPNAVGFVILLGVAQGGLSISSDLTTGSYRLISPLDAVILPPAGTRLMYPMFEKLDDSCAGTLGASGMVTSGSVNVDGFEAGKSVHGTFDLTFGDGAGQGSYNATFCDYSFPTSPTAPTCG